MAEKEFESEDPFELTGMVIPMSPEKARRSEEAMAACFIEEYLMLGYDALAILELFRDPFYQATHAVLHARGEEYVRSLIEKVIEGDAADSEKEASHG